MLTSPASSPALGPIGLAILRSESQPRDAVDVALGEGTIGATVDVLAVHDPEKRRPRS